MELSAVKTTGHAGVDMFKSYIRRICSKERQFYDFIWGDLLDLYIVHCLIKCWVRITGGFVTTELIAFVIVPQWE